MKCPVCKDVTLLMAERNGVEIEYCPECRGVWLDRGELDKIIERARRGEFSGSGRGGRDARDGRFHEAEERARCARPKPDFRNGGPPLGPSHTRGARV